MSETSTDQLLFSSLMVKQLDIVPSFIWTNKLLVHFRENILIYTSTTKYPNEHVV